MNRSKTAREEEGGKEGKRRGIGGVTVTDTAIEDDGYKIDKPASPKITQPVRDTPQTIQVISKELFNEQGATTLTEVLRNSPGVGTFYAGENGNTTSGDAIRMSGFDTPNSIFVDGIRDLGSVSRSEERRVGKECSKSGKSRWSRYQLKKQ